MLTPTPGKVLLTPYLHSEAFADEVKKRSGLLMVKPDNHTGRFEGLPNQGFVVALHDDYRGPLKVGARVVFSENNPKGFKNPEDPKQTLFALDLDQIIAELTND